MVSREYVDEEFEMARQALGDAERLAEGGGSDEGILNRLYFAAFHAAQAALYDRGVEPSSHGAVRNRFGAHLVRDGDVTREHGRLLTTLADLRQQADYGYDPIDEDANALLERTSAFVDAMEALVGDESAGSGTK